MDEDLFHNEDLSEGNLVLHRDKGVGRVVGRTTRQFKGEDTEYVKIEFGDGFSEIPVALAVESGKYSRFDGPKSTSLGRLATGKKQRAQVSKQMGLERRAEELLHDVGIYHPEILAERLRTDGYDVAPARLKELPGQRLVGEYLVSTDHHSHMAQAVRALRHIGVEEPEEITSGLRRVLQSKSAVKTGTKRIAAKTYVDETTPDWADWPAPTPEEDIQDHLTLLRYVESQSGGVLTGKELNSYVQSQLGRLNGTDPAGNSPLLERVANGLVGGRGAPIDLVSVEEKRNKKRGGWAPWGRLDRNRAWVEVRSRGTELKARLTNDCSELLGYEPYRLYSETGTHVGTLEIVTEGGTKRVVIEWLHDRPSDWLPEEHSAVVEFGVGSDRSASLLSGSSTSEPDHPRYTDGCVLVNGKWRAIVELTQSVIDGGGVNVPLVAVSRGVEMEVGEVSTLGIDGAGGKSIRLTREPHTIRLDGFSEANPEVRVDGFALVHCGEQQCHVQLADATPDPTTRLHRSAGLFEKPRLFWSAIGSALGWGNDVNDRQQVRIALANRLRFDLVALTHDAKPTKTSDQVDVDPADFQVLGGYLCRDHATSPIFADGTPGGGAFGLLWKEERGGDDNLNPQWAEITLTFIRAWSATNSDEAVTIRKGEAGWTTSHHLEPCKTLREALVLMAAEPNVFVPGQHSECFPGSYLGYLKAFDNADKRLRELKISEAGWWGEDDSGNLSGPTPIAALNGVSV